MDRLINGNADFWSSIILVLNSGMNSIIYFFRGKCESYQEKLFKTYLPTVVSSAISTPNIPRIKQCFVINSGKDSPTILTPTIQRSDKCNIISNQAITNTIV